MSVLEAEIEQHCKDYAKKCGFYLLKIQNARGWPDRLLLTNDGRVVWMEFKRPHGIVAPLQAYYHKNLQNMGFQVHVVYSEEQFKSILADLRRKPGSLMTTNSAPYIG